MTEDNYSNRAASGNAALTTARGSQFLDYAFFLLYTLLTIRFVLALLAANPANGFVRFINTVTGPFYGHSRASCPASVWRGATRSWSRS